MSYTFKYKMFAEVLYDALIEDAFYNTMEESVVHGSPKQAMLRYLDYSIFEAEKFGRLVIPNGSHYGISVWAKPLNGELEAEKNKRKKDFLKTYMGEASLETYSSIVGFMAQKTSQTIPDNAWYLSIIGVLPRFQGKGLGMELIDTVLKDTDLQGISTYLETFTPRTISFYNKLGYKPVDCVREPTTNADYWILARTV